MFLLDLMIGNRPYKWPCGIKFYIAPILIISTAWISFGVQSFQSFLLTMLWETCSELRWKITFKKHSFKKKTDHDDFISPLFVSNEFVFLKRLKTYSFQDRQGKIARILLHRCDSAGLVSRHNYHILCIFYNQY